MADPLTLFGPLDALGPFVEPLLVFLVLGNLGTRLLAYRDYREQAASGDDLERFLPHEVTNVVLVLISFYFLTYEYYAGMVVSVLVVAVVVIDFFEFEARAVENRRGEPLEPPKAAIAGSMLTLGYLLYNTLFFLVEPLWRVIV